MTPATNKRKKRNQVDPRDKGTPETRRKLSFSTMQRLIEKNRLTGYELRAAQEIESVFDTLCRGMFAKTMNWSERIDKAHTDMPDWFVTAYHERYKPWADRMSMLKKKRGNVAHEIIIDILTEGMGGKAIDQRNGWGKGTAVSFFISGLRDYASMAGWADANTVSEWSNDKRIPKRVQRMWADTP